MPEVKFRTVHLFLTSVLMTVLVAGCGLLRKKRGSSTVFSCQLSEIRDHLPPGITISGNPGIIDSPFGKAVHFNGINDAFFFNTNPLQNIRRFTIEVIMKPDADGPFAQRFLHLGQSKGQRVLMEIRNQHSGWYLDSYLNSKTSLALADSSKTHKAGKWYNVAFVVDNGKMDTYVNGEHELSGEVKFIPFAGGETSLGVRLNRQYWFKGTIFEVRISSKKLKPSEFLKIN